MKSGDIVIYKNEIGTVVTDYDNRNVMRFLPCNYGTYSTSRLNAITEDNVREATHEEKLNLIEREYHWGRVVQIHCVGEYQIVEAIHVPDIELIKRLDGEFCEPRKKKRPLM